jgi:HPt (histidine-containing phosphotransfer) domain-containing protein
MTIARKLWLGFGVLILIFLVADLTIIELDAVLKRWTSREEESTDGLEEPLDEVVLAGLRELGVAELLSELSTMFLDASSSSLAALREAVEEGDALTVERVAHTLKGAAGNMGAAELLGRLEKEFGRVRPALEAEAARDF